LRTKANYPAPWSNNFTAIDPFTGANLSALHDDRRLSDECLRRDTRSYRYKATRATIGIDVLIAAILLLEYSIEYRHV
jgi:hypothetical protein